MFLAFLVEQWMLVSALVVCVLLLIFHETRRGGPSLTPNEVVMLVNQKEAAVIDLRDAAEFRQGHIVDAVNLPFNKVDERWSEFEALRERPLILVCKLGQHSSAVGKKLRAKGFSDVHRLGGGINEWSAAQLPLVKG